MQKRKIKALALISFLIIFFFLLLGFRTIVSASCNDNCHDCLSANACNSENGLNNSINCTWYALKGQCFKGLETDWPPAPGGLDLTGESTLLDFIGYIFNWGILLGGLAAFYALVLGGFKYLTSIGDPIKMTEAKDRIISAILGLVLLLSSFIVLNFLNPELTVLHVPSPTGGNFSQGNFDQGNSNTPCEEVKFYKQPGWNNLFAAYFKDANKWTTLGKPKCSDITFPNTPNPGFDDGNCVIDLAAGACQQVGDAGWLFGIGESHIPMGSVKITGACVLTAYTDNSCHDNPVNLSGNDNDITDLFTGNRHSIKLFDRTPPTKPVIVYNKEDNLLPNDPQYKSFNGTDTCQVTLHGILKDTGSNAYVRISLEYGPSKDQMTGFPPQNDNWGVPDVIPLNPSYWNTKEGLQVESPISSEVKFDHYLTGIPAKMGTTTTYYWTLKACGTEANLCGITGDPEQNYATFTLSIVQFGVNKFCNLNAGPLP